MKKTFTFFLVLLLVFSMTACGNKDNTDDTPKEPVYTVTEAEYLSIKTMVNNPKNFIDGNFTATMNLGGGVSVNKFADGKFDGHIQGNHFVIVFDTSTYNVSEKTATSSSYYYDEDDEKWYRESDKTVNLGQYYPMTILYTEYFPNTFEELSYNADKREYSAIMTILDSTVSFRAQFKDGKLLSYTFVGFVAVEFSDYGTTTVTPPTEYEEE